MFGKKLFSFIKNKIPKISQTELIALKSGNTSLDRTILQGKFFLPEKSIIVNKFPQQKLDKLLNTFDNSKIYPNNNNNNYWINYLAKEKYFSFLIYEKYHGIKLCIC